MAISVTTPAESTILVEIGGMLGATGGTVDTTITDGSTNAVSSNAVYDALALKAPLASPVFTGTVTAANADSGTGADISSNSGRGADIYSYSGRGADIHSDSGTGADIYSDSGNGANISSGSGTGADIYSDSGTGAGIYSYTGTYHATFGNTGIDRSFVARLKGAFGWIRGAFTGRIYPPDTLTGDRTWELPDASGTLALTSDIPAAPTAASIATALNAGTQDSTAADTDKLAVTHPAGGWMLLSTLWTWITGKLDTFAKLNTISGGNLARTDAGQTFAGAQAFNGQISSSGSTDATNTNNVVNVAANDARYGRDYVQVISTAVEAFSTTYVNGPDLVLPAGTYDFEMTLLLETASETAGGQSNFRCSPTTDTTWGIDTRLSGISALGVSGTVSTSFRKGTNILNSADYLATTNFDAPNNYASVSTKGSTVLASETTVSFRVKQRTATDAVNATKIAVGSFMRFTKR